MAICPSCSAPLQESSRFCSSCGAPTPDSSAVPTGTAPRSPASDKATRRLHGTSSGRLSSTATGGGRFAPGALLNERYRIVGLLGKGGMGEVYRADDLTLGQAVALKFLPERLAHDPARLDRFYNEVRMAREISHSSVCRVHDIDDMDGQPFISMELVDGEDLASLLRRIGRLPSAKALEIARQVCAGLTAAHEKGVLHRDLKPENVMLDGRGRARITDFGLAAVVEEIHGAEVRSGTPAYMSPEQLAGREVTVRSDIYALGLVLFELFTGQRAFEGGSLAELTRQHLAETPPRPCELVPELEPAVERVILRCLAKEPAKRPQSALAVAAALPGGDPLAAALAAGETPSPEMVAAAGEEGGLRPRVAWSLLAAVGSFVLLSLGLSQSTQLQAFVPYEKAPAVLEDRSRELLRELGAGDDVVDRASGLSADGAFLDYWADQRTAPDRWEILRSGRPPVVRFWYRQSPRILRSTGLSGRVRSWDPAEEIAGSAGIWLDTKGRLVELYATPPQREESPSGPVTAPDWSRLFTLAGLDLTDFQPVEPSWTPPFFCDARAAWEGVYPEAPEVAIRLEAAAYRGRPVYFRPIGAWTRPEREEPPVSSLSAERIWANRIAIALFLTTLLAGALLARRNLRLGRGDWRGALRLAAFTLAASLLEWFLVAHHVPDFIGELGVFFRGLASSLLSAGALWMLYLALEPYVRRRWPDVLISWTRLIAGGRRDPLVGSHVLLGMGAGALATLLLAISTRLPGWLGRTLDAPSATGQAILAGARDALGIVVGLLVAAVVTSLGFLLLLFLLRVALRSEKLAAAMLVLLLAVQTTLQNELSAYLGLPLFGVMWTVLAVVVLRFGLLALSAAVFTLTLLANYPLSLDFAHWTGHSSLLVLVVFAALALWAFRVSLAGRPLLDDDLLHR
jgi:serine/threonine-protein kinase